MRRTPCRRPCCAPGSGGIPLRKPAYFGTWLNRILINECKTLLRKRKRQLPTADLPNLAAPPPDEQAMALRTALFALPEAYRVPLVLNLLEG